MYKIISNEIIRKFHPCYDPSKVITDENEELPIKDWVQKYRKLVPANDIIWLLLREEFISEKDLILFSVWCARESLKLIENPDERSVEACNVVERYANGEATKEDLLAARVAAHDASTAVYITYDADFNAARYAFISAATYAAHDAANAANAAFAATDTVSDADAAYDATYAATRASQLDQLLTYFE
jgi:hypothetical protein